MFFWVVGPGFTGERKGAIHKSHESESCVLEGW